MRKPTAAGNRNVVRKESKRLRMSDDLSDIDEAEIAGYINNESQVEFRKMMWDLMYKNYLEGKQQKKALRPKKGLKKSDNRSAKIGGGRHNKEEERAMMSSKINYDVLKKALEEGDKDEKEDKEGVSSQDSTNLGLGGGEEGGEDNGNDPIVDNYTGVDYNYDFDDEEEHTHGYDDWEDF
ncbi:hypothetical protein K2173_012209 [Erythroxylum novogranatense]|uniref:Brf1 TBP-binding domain-containing protein n=1 Tax=Erythroxylum novogranatense TaxID=1862640 RepID=A0AAV8T7F3_9ROSI|nr:hypothetical protein K2173_012209 [Erythroxylum novogranatense]